MEPCFNRKQEESPACDVIEMIYDIRGSTKSWRLNGKQEPRSSASPHPDNQREGGRDEGQEGGLAGLKKMKVPEAVLRPWEKLHPTAAVAFSAMDLFEKFEELLDVVVCLALLYFLSQSSLLLLYLYFLVPLAFVFKEEKEEEEEEEDGEAEQSIPEAQ